MQTEFPILEAVLVKIVPPPPMPPMLFPFFVVAYWPRGGWWQVSAEEWEAPDCEGIQKKIAKLQASGWTYIHIIRLPL